MNSTAEARSERDSVDGRAVAIGGAVIFTVLLAVAIGLAAALKHWNFRAEGANASLDFEFPKPRLLSAPRADRAAFLAEKKKIIESYRWDGRSATAAIPIDTAMQIMIDDARRGGQ